MLLDHHSSFDLSQDCSFHRQCTDVICQEDWRRRKANDVPDIGGRHGAGAQELR